MGAPNPFNVSVTGAEHVASVVYKLFSMSQEQPEAHELPDTDPHESLLMQPLLATRPYHRPRAIPIPANITIQNINHPQ